MGTLSLQTSRHLHNMKTIAIIGGTGGTGKWAVKGALLKGYKVKLLARNPDKVTKVLSTLFDADTLKTLQENVVVVAGGVMDDAVLDDLLADTEAVLSFLGMVDQKVWVVSPGVESIINDLEASEKMIAAERENGESGLNMMVIRSPVLKDSKSYELDFLSEEKDYHLIAPTDCVKVGGVFIDRQQVAGGFLTALESSQWDGTTVTVSKIP